MTYLLASGGERLAGHVKVLAILESPVLLTHSVTFFVSDEVVDMLLLLEFSLPQAVINKTNAIKNSTFFISSPTLLKLEVV